ncbi:diguanylate cyclase (GGDEF) domain-containing protein [Sulfurivirga caldicuralii]|uniref:diguanylate cyclase n=1 Tax=Sulfurivirga caldicuralii TaxID=364032 RepID=A0A1N6DWM3_9GAMM|nr:GGDEF domain-containing protein [Sulfurivirga caldicuralii]SIN75189.1 diguanylate cyclase (GGDEF) domain-containing protein [Sulfurivirga caldicuralii]
MSITLEDMMAGLRLIRGQLLRFSEIPAAMLYQLIEEIERGLAQGYFKFELAESAQRLGQVVRNTEQGELPDKVPREIIRPLQWLLPQLEIWASFRPVNDATQLQDTQACSLTPLLKVTIEDDEILERFLQQHAEQHTAALSLDYFVQQQGWTLANSLLERVVFLSLSLHAGLLAYFLQRTVSDFRHDALTGLLLRHDLESAFSRALAQSLKAGKGLALILLDLDHFKAINDTHGHGGGDAVLQQVAARIRAQLREGDVAMRYGGEEMLLLLPGVSCDQVAGICERIRSAIEQALVQWDGRTIPVTTSIGCVCIESLDEELNSERLIQAADENLYRAKEGGRNQVVCSTVSA